MVKKMKNKSLIERLIRRYKPNAQSMLDLYFQSTSTSGDVGDADFHVDMIVHLASVIRPTCYVELGVYECETFNRVSRFAETSYAVDIESKASLHKKKGYFYNGTTMEFLDFFKVKDKKIDMLFIDADHSAASVKQEFESFFPYVSDQGLIILHDSYPKDKTHTDQSICGDGFLAIAELSTQASDYEMVTIPFPPGLTICRKRNKQVPWN